MVNLSSKMVFIVGPHKSGTTLLLRLLNGHKSIFTIPFETHIAESLGYWQSYRGRTNLFSDLEFNDKITRFIDHFEYAVMTPSQFNNGKSMENLFDLNHFKEIMNSIPEVDDKELVHSYLEAIITSYHQAFDHDFVVEKSVTHDEFVPFLSQIFPDAKFIRILRNPYANLVSFRRYISDGRFPLLKKPLLAIKDATNYLFRNKRLLGARYKVVKYENLLESPEITLQSLATFIGISYDPIMLKPTFNQEIWEGNSSREMKFSKISSENLYLWKEDITEIEKRLVTKHLDKFLDYYNYNIEPYSSFRSLLPVWREGLVTWFLNRSLLQLN